LRHLRSGERLRCLDRAAVGSGLGREPFFELLEEHPEISQNIMQMLTRRLRRLLAMLSADNKA